MAAYGIATPFSFNSLGGVSAVTDSKQIWRDRVYLTMLTRFGERVMHPDFGTDLNSALFEGQELATEIAVRTVTIAFNKWLPSLNLNSIRPAYDIESGTLTITVSYALPSGQTDEVVFSTAVLTRSGDLIRE